MKEESQEIQSLKKIIGELRHENAMLRRDFTSIRNLNTVSVPDNVKPLFDKAQEIVGEYFKNLKMEPNKGTIEINDQRYVLVRASALSTDFLNTIQLLYADRGEKEAMSIGKNFLFDIAHVIGINDAVNFHTKMNLTDPISKLSAGPVHFAYSGWAYVDILPESNPSPDDGFYMIYDHPFSFEADSWMRSGKKSDTPVCIMNAGYSSGWCEQSFGMPLTAVEVTCKAKGDDMCRFIMSPPHKIEAHIKKYEDAMSGRNEEIVYDIPTFFERKRVEEEMEKARVKAEESDKAKSEFLANMSHEIRTPMNAIIGYVDLILKDKLQAEHRSYLETVKESGHLLLNLINDVLDLSKIEAGQLVLEISPVSIKELLIDAQVMAKGLLIGVKSNLTLHLEIDEKINDEILVDGLRLRQVLNNLLSNAIKFTSEGHVTMHVKLEEAFIHFFVEDSGIGLDEKDFEKIFDMFGQADASSTRQYGGSGLGLTISQKIVELMGGKMWVDSKLGEGSSFHFTIPYKPNLVVRDKSDKIDRHVSQDRDSVMLVEDNLINQRLTKLILEKAGYRVITANNGKEAVDLFESDLSIRLIIMDIQMPVLDGLSATKMIREKEFLTGKRIPIIALTAHAMKGDKERCLEAGCDHYLSKPIMIESLIATIKKCIPA
ncbi:MAG: response regulator [Bacteroidetes bacterium]|nr:response regulator [Bacteroidota bacterium]